MSDFHVFVGGFVNARFAYRDIERFTYAEKHIDWRAMERKRPVAASTYTTRKVCFIEISLVVCKRTFANPSQEIKSSHTEPFSRQARKRSCRERTRDQAEDWLYVFLLF